MVPICNDCHREIHRMFTNHQLARTYNTVESLLAHEKFSRTVRFISKQRGHVKSVPRRKR
jgi:hypothetical protein